MSDGTKLKFIVSTFDLMELNAQRAADLITMLSQRHDCGELLIQADEYVQQTHKLGVSIETLMNKILDQETTQEMNAVDVSEAS